MLKPRIFVSAVSSEFASSRRLVAESLTRLGYEPETQGQKGSAAEASFSSFRPFFLIDF